jgi:hypothetical protein
MPKLRIIAATLAACLCALGLSVGAAMAEGMREPQKPAKAAHTTPSGVCLLKDAPR